MMLRSPCRLVPDATDEERAKHNAAALALVTQQLPELSHSHNSTQMATQFNWGIGERFLCGTTIYASFLTKSFQYRRAERAGRRLQPCEGAVPRQLTESRDAGRRWEFIDHV